MELAFKCAALGMITSLTALLLRRYHPEYSFLLSVAAVTGILLSSASLISALQDALQSIKQALGASSELLLPLLKCLGISVVSKIGSGLCRDASQSALAAAVETVAVLSAMVIAMPTIASTIRTIGGIL